MLVPWLVAAAPLAAMCTRGRRRGHSDNPRWPPFIDYEMLAGITIWASLFVVVLSYAMDLALMWLDPRIRTAQR
jgi:hypothetical protein